VTPLSWLWAWATARRLARGRPIDPGVAVVVWEISPWAARERLRSPWPDEDSRRGGPPSAHTEPRHGGRLTGPLRVDAKAHTAAQVGDEALNDAGEAPVWVAKDRVVGARAAAAAGAGIIVMDDGHQNPAVAKTLSLDRGRRGNTSR